MWWIPTDDTMAVTAREVERLLRLYREHLADTGMESGNQLVWGVGSAPGVQGDWRHPLVLASYEGRCGPAVAELLAVRVAADTSAR